jgi:hypothetical protein
MNCVHVSREPEPDPNATAVGRTMADAFHNEVEFATWRRLENAYRTRHVLAKFKAMSED